METLISNMEDKNSVIFHAEQESSLILMFLCGGYYPFKTNVVMGDKARGQKIAYFERPFPCKYCKFQEIKAYNAENQLLGTVTETVWYCIPTFQVHRADGSVEYKVHPPTCCGGICIDCWAEGFNLFWPPWYVFPPDTPKGGIKEEMVGKTSKIRGNFYSECLGFRKYKMEFPKDASADSKARLFGAALLLKSLNFV